jgi:A/G-specific adenine glycosylase
LAKTVENPNRKSRHYTVQSGFEGSDRQLRGKIIRLLLHEKASEKGICQHLRVEKERIKGILDDMIKEGFIAVRNDTYSIV